MQKLTLVTSILFVAGIYSCGLSPEEKETRKKSLLIKEQSLQYDLKQMEDSLIKLKDDLDIANQELKKAERFHLISPTAIQKYIKIQSTKIQIIQKEISNLEINITETKRQIRQLEIQANSIN